MFKVKIYEDEAGKSEIKDFFEALNKEALTSKFSRVRLRKIVAYIEALKVYGTKIGAPQVKHIANTDFWELRPTRDRIFFVYWKNDTFVLLHHFVKKTQKTPIREIEKTKRILADFLERSVSC